MPTKIADVIIPEVFNPYVVNRTMELSALYQSGIVVNDPEFDRLASQAAKTINMPYWNDLTGDDELLDDTAPLTPGKITAGQDEAVILRRGKAWGVNDLAANLAGDDPLKVIGDLVAAYWARRIQAVLLSVLGGVFAGAGMAGNVLDISAAQAPADPNITASAFVDAAQMLGDAKSQLTGVMMHSATEASLAKQNLILTQPDEREVEVKTFMGKRVIVDDSCPADQGVYTTYLFGPGAIALGNGNPVGFIPTETARDGLAGEDYLINRKTFILHPRGVAWTPGAGVPVGVSPTNAELAADNWNRVYENKAIRVVAFRHLNG